MKRPPNAPLRPPKNPDRSQTPPPQTPPPQTPPPQTPPPQTPPPQTPPPQTPPPHPPPQKSGSNGLYITTLAGQKLVCNFLPHYVGHFCIEVLL